MSSRPFHVGRAFTGLGLFATRVIKRAGYIATYRGPILTTEEAERRERQGAKYMFELSKKLTIDGSPRWNVARYMNHSCWPNAKPVIKGGKITFVALRDISPGEEITYNYGKEYYEYFLRNGGCLCAGCRIREAARRARKTAPVHAGAGKTTKEAAAKKVAPKGDSRSPASTSQSETKPAAAEARKPRSGHGKARQKSLAIPLTSQSP